MDKKILISILAAAFLLAGCATLESAGHKYIMRGQILEVTGDTVYLCIGSSDGAKVGQEYAVVKFVKVPKPYDKPPVPYFKREETGVVKITEIVHEHMANAKIVSGAAKENDMVELK
jgi:predicted small secreted protein